MTEMADEVHHEPTTANVAQPTFIYIALSLLITEHDQLISSGMPKASSLPFSCSYLRYPQLTPQFNICSQSRISMFNTPTAPVLLPQYKKSGVPTKIVRRHGTAT